ncbi:DUF6069 family protein [Saccharomonospora sp. NPDC046836]|uniref:DUF6069 family protein n=1 Tax=Saccharomonospora sp. NPDC046836 TaxID=3156921 RepID=UPI0033C2B5AC
MRWTEILRSDGDLTSRRRRGSWSRGAVVATAVVAAVAINLVVYATGLTAGARYAFTRDGRSMAVDAVTVAGFTAVPLLAGLLLVAVAGPRWPALYRFALVGAPLAAVGTIGLMTLPAGFDTASTIALATCHLTLAPLSFLAAAALRHRRQRSTRQPLAAGTPLGGTGSDGVLPPERRRS